MSSQKYPWVSHPWFNGRGPIPAHISVTYPVNGGPVYTLANADDFASCMGALIDGGYVNRGAHVEVPEFCRYMAWSFQMSNDGQRRLSMYSSPFRIDLGSDLKAAYYLAIGHTRGIHLQMQNEDPAAWGGGCCPLDLEERRRGIHASDAMHGLLPTRDEWESQLDLELAFQNAASDKAALYHRVKANIAADGAGRPLPEPWAPLVSEYLAAERAMEDAANAADCHQAEG